MESRDAWLHIRKGPIVLTYRLPYLIYHRSFTPSFGPYFRYGLRGAKLYFANIGPTIHMSQTTLEVYDVASGQLLQTLLVPGLSKSKWPLVLTESILIDISSSPQTVNLENATARRVLRDCDDYRDLGQMGGCFHNDNKMILCIGEGGYLRVFESTLGNYSPTHKVPKHLKIGSMVFPAVISVSSESVLIYGMHNDENRSIHKIAIVYDTRLKCGEICGKMPGKPAAVLSHAVYNGYLYALLADGRAMVCDLQTGIAKSFALEDWNAVKGVLWAYKYRIGALPISLFRAIVIEYVCGRSSE